MGGYMAGGMYGGMAQTGRERREDLKHGRRMAQAMAVERKAADEADYFWTVRTQQHLSYEGAARQVSPAQLEKDEKELFSQAGAAGINFDQYDNIPVEVSGPDAEAAAPLEHFSSLGEVLPEFLTDNVTLMNYSKPTPIQRHAIPLALAGMDLMCCAQTGSGKTCAFLLPVVAALAHNSAPQDASAGEGPAAPQAVVLAPTRELACQIHLEARKLCHRSGMRAVVVYGGADARQQLKELAFGCTVLVATPGRLTDFVDRGVVTLSATRFAVLDEADRMLDMGFEPQIRALMQMRDMPPKETRQTLLFSATFPGEIQRLARDFLRQYVWIAVGRVGSTVEGITQKLLLAAADKNVKFDLLLGALGETDGRTLVFVQKKKTASWLAGRLYRYGRVEAESIHGDRTQSQREAALAAFREGRIRVLVATDVAARGLDVPAVKHVINFDLPTAAEEFDSYVHRIGRTGRAGHTGLATSFFVPGSDPKTGNGRIASLLLRLLKEAGQEVPEWLPGQAAGGGGGPGAGAGAGRGRGSYTDVRGGQRTRYNAAGGGGGMGRAPMVGGPGSAMHHPGMLSHPGGAPQMMMFPGPGGYAGGMGGGMGYAGGMAPMMGGYAAMPMAAPGHGQGVPGEIRAGDWTCGSCGANVFASRSECFRCHAPKAGGTMTMAMGGGMGGGRGRGRGAGGLGVIGAPGGPMGGMAPPGPGGHMAPGHMPGMSQGDMIMQMQAAQQQMAISAAAAAAAAQQGMGQPMMASPDMMGGAMGYHPMGGGQM